MAQTVKIKKTTKRRVKKTGDGYRQCGVCHGTGKVKAK